MFQNPRTTHTKREEVLRFLAAVILAAPVLLVASSGGADPGYTGAPASAVDFGDCTHCHGGTAKSSGLTVSGISAGLTYTPGATQRLTVTVPASSMNRMGF